MADLKISQLNSIVTVVPATDVLPVVQGGTTLKITPNQILGAGGTATLASATITGAATVTGAANLNGAVNLSTSGTPTVTLGASSSYGVLLASGTNAASLYLNGATRTGFESKLQYGAAEHNWYNSALSSLIATLNTTGFGIGVAPVAGSGAIQLSAGVGFPATQVASANANTLDDYEEGSWTPTLNSGTFSAATGRYTKIGNMVTIFFDVTVGTGGGIQITNLPFAAASTSTVANGIYTNAQTYAAGTTAPVVVVGGSSSTMYFRTVGTGVGLSTMTLTAAASLTGSISYFV